MARRFLLLVIVFAVCPSSIAFQRNHDKFRTFAGPEQHRLPVAAAGDVRLIERLYSNRRRPSTAIGATAKFRNFEEMLDTFHDTPVLVSFHTRHCGPCKLMKKELRAVQEEIGDEVHVFAVDTEKWPSVSARYKVAGLPTLVLFYQGKILYRVEGVETADKLVHRVKTLI